MTRPRFSFYRLVRLVFNHQDNEATGRKQPVLLGTTSPGSFREVSNHERHEPHEKKIPPPKNQYFILFPVSPFLLSFLSLRPPVFRVVRVFRG